jgi:hypothetical protein
LYLERWSPEDDELLRSMANTGQKLRWITAKLRLAPPTIPFPGTAIGSKATRQNGGSSFRSLG